MCCQRLQNAPGCSTFLDDDMLEEYNAWESVRDQMSAQQRDVDFDRGRAAVRAMQYFVRFMIIES
jgi:hypothetical protein